MSTLRTYSQERHRGGPPGGGARGRFAALLLTLALALVCAGVGAAPAVAWANTSGTMLGINLAVPSTTQQGAGSATTGGSSGTGGALGINLKVPDTLPTQPDPGPGTNPGAGSGESATGGNLGINLVVPSTTQTGGGHDTTGGTSGTGGSLGINLVVPSITEEGPKPGGDDYDSTASTNGMLGINLVIPSTTEQVGSGTSGTQGTLGINLKVPKGTGVSFDPNHGQGQVLYVPVTPGEPVEKPAYEPTWPNRVFVGWFAEQKDYVTDDDVPWDFSTPVDGNRTLYAGWKLVDPLEDGTVRLHLVVDEDYSPEIAAAEAESHGIVPPGYVLDPDDTQYGPTYVGGYHLGGGEELDSTLALPEPQMDGGFFETWRTEYSPALDEDGSPIAGKVGSYGGDAKTQIGRFDTGSAVGQQPADGQHAHELWAQWDFVETHTVTFVSNGGSDVAPVKVRDGGYAPAPTDPVREGWDFGGWYEDEGLTWAFDFATARIVRDITLYAKWTPRETPPDPPVEVLDVTVPVSVGFAVNADTGEVMTPDMDKYAIKSRSEHVVAVERLDLTTAQEDVESFFALPDGKTDWQEALEQMFLRVRSERAQDDIGIAFAGDAGPEGGVWSNGRALTEDERADYTLAAFNGPDAGDQWWLTDACNRLNLKFAMDVPVQKGLITVNTNLDGPQRITTLKVTVTTVP